MRVLVTGASRGIGRALVEAYARRGDEVIGTVRDRADAPAIVGARFLVMDVADGASVKRARAAIAVPSLDVVVNNAGVTGGAQKAPGFDLARAERILSVNAMGPIRVYDAFVDLLRAGDRPRLVDVSSEAGSLTHFRASKKPEYAMSKAALNALTQWIAATEASITCVSIDPGWTKTATGGEGATQTAERAAERMIAAIDRLAAEHSGGFFDADLHATPW